ncbi:TolC family protein [Calycomorphotria hydatis]|uniref:Outer membrane efflux protein n=1 Tax=Calycomorphotria hydatis TaxID=2528027 RepID=A0A517T7D6_9PLAN|nr:TolC family protein [Calycomorphotria hydatis]QDT64286.1 Outer membrane efflux protein [Calycomorphotria hydatis]
MRACSLRMPRRVCGCVLLAGAFLTILSGCSSYDWWRLKNDNKYGTTHPEEVVTQVDYTVPVNATIEHDPDPIQTMQPRTVLSDKDGACEYWDMSVEEAIQYGLMNSKVMRKLGGTVIRTPEAVTTRYDTAIQYTDPRTGPEAALAAFDAEFATRAFFENNDRAVNNRFFGGGTNFFVQDLNIYQTELRKRAATGSQFSLRSNTEYDANNAPANLFPSAWQTNIEAEVRQPLLQGNGLLFNRLAGPDSVPGVYNGVVIARVENEMTQAEFELALRDFVSDIVNAYWELYYSYRNLDVLKKARDRALTTWQSYDAQFRENRVDADREALAREQYYRFQLDVEAALAGRPTIGTQTGTGDGGGTFRGIGGVQTAERRLRLLMGVPITDCRMIRPTEISIEQPEIIYDWCAISAEALSRRPELRRQRLEVKQREMELAAARNYLSPRLDAIGLYRWRGFGNDLLAYDDPDPLASAVGNLADGEFQEWQLGVEFSVPLGRRLGHAAVQNAELLIARNRAILREQERQIVYDLSNAIAEKDRAYLAAQTSLNRFKASYNLLRSLDEQIDLGRDIDLDRLLDAQRRVVAAEVDFFTALSSYQVAQKNVHFEKSSLFEAFGVYLDGASDEMIPPITPAAPIEPPPAPAVSQDSKTPGDNFASTVSYEKPTIDRIETVAEALPTEQFNATPINWSEFAETDAEPLASEYVTVGQKNAVANEAVTSSPGWGARGDDQPKQHDESLQATPVDPFATSVE